MKTTLSLLALAAVIVVIGTWSEKRAEAADKAYTAYEQCVQTEYHTTPAAYYQEHGTTPECN